MPPPKEHRRNPRNYLARREQWRLLTLILALGLVVVAMAQLRRPETRRMLGLMFGLIEQEEAGAPTEPPMTEDEIAALLQSSQPDPLPPGTFRSPAEPSATAEPEQAAGFLPGVDVAALRDISDSAPWRSREGKAWFNLFDVLQRTPSEKLKAASLGKITHAQLTRQPNEYRGQVVTVQGEVRQIIPETPAKNDLGLTGYYQLTIKPDGGPNRPTVVYCLELPDGFPRGGRVAESVELDGLFFKNWLFPAESGIGLGPVVLAKQLTWLRAEAADKSSGASSITSFIVTLVVAAILAGFVIWRIIRQTPERIAVLWFVAWGGSMFGITEAFAAEAPPSSPRAILELTGIDASYLSKLQDGEPLGDDEQELVLKLHKQVQRFSPLYLMQWTNNDVDLAATSISPGDTRAMLFTIHGRVLRIEAQSPPPEVVERYELATYYHVHVKLAPDNRPAVIVTSNIPDAWKQHPELNEPCSASAMFLKVGGEVDGRQQLVFLANRVQWHPNGKGAIKTNFGLAVLGISGVDVGLFDGVRQGTPLGAADALNPSRSDDREPFYQMLHACGQLGAKQLAKRARQNLRFYAMKWTPHLPKPGSDVKPDLNALIAREVHRQAAENRFSVAPLFRDAQQQVGELFVFDGIARRAIKIFVGKNSHGKVSDVARRFGIEHYYEVEVFTGDSQSLPLVFCLRELPDGFPVGEEIHEEIRVAGFFLKKWRYQSRKVAQDASPAARDKSIQLSPLLIGRGPIWILPDPSERSPFAGMIAGGLFVLAMVGICLGMWRYARGDRRFYRRAIASRYEVAPDQSLNDAGIEAMDGPDFSDLDNS